MTTLHDQFVHGLKDIYGAENELLDALEQLEDQTEHEEIAASFREHRTETEIQIDRLDDVFEMVDEEPTGEPCEGIEGLITEHESFVEMDPDQRLLDLHNIAAGQKTEYYEIASYTHLALIANQLGESEAAEVLVEILEEEQAALETLSDHMDDFEFDAVMEPSAAD